MSSPRVTADGSRGEDSLHTKLRRAAEDLYVEEHAIEQLNDKIRSKEKEMYSLRDRLSRTQGYEGASPDGQHSPSKNPANSGLELVPMSVANYTGEPMATEMVLTLECPVDSKAKDNGPKAGKAYGSQLPLGLHRSTSERERVRARRKTVPRSHKSNIEKMMELPMQCRLGLRKLVLTKTFDYFVLLLVLVNCVFLALDSPLLDPESTLAKVVNAGDVVFVVLFAVEAGIKMIALGLTGSEIAYFRDAWNWLDFIIVVEGIITSVAGNSSSGLSGLRTFRVLRPLRTVSRLRGLRVLVQAMLSSLPLLCNTLVMCCFYFFIFGIIAVQLWKGLFHYRCFDPNTMTIHPDLEEQLCGGEFDCPSGYECLRGAPNPNNGVTSYDNILWAFNTIFMCITLEGWADVMYWTQDVAGAIVWMYYVLLILFGAFILMNLALAVIMIKFRESLEKQEEEKRKAEEKLRLLLEKQALRKAQGRKVIHGDGGSEYSDSSSAEYSEEGTAEDSEIQDSSLDSEALEVHEVAIDPTTENPLSQHPEIGPRTVSMTDTLGIEKEFAEARRATVIGLAGSRPIAKKSRAHIVRRRAEKEKRCTVRCRRKTARCCRTTFCPVLRVSKNWYLALQRKLRPVVDSRWFNITIMICILLNAAALSIDHARLSQDVERALTIVNLVFTIIFAIEMLIKLVGLGPKDYVKDRFNVFDAIIVTLGFIEFSIGSSNSSLTALRTARIFRVLKLVRYFESMCKILDVVSRSLSSFGYIALLLLLFCFIYSVLGMQLFGGMWKDKGPDFEKPRNHFDSLHWSFVTVFQILAGEAWNEIMTLYVGEKGAEYALYFVSWVIIGQFILLNLFLAVLLENFSESSDDDEERKRVELFTVSEVVNIWKSGNSTGSGGLPDRSGSPASPLRGSDPERKARVSMQALSKWKQKALKKNISFTEAARRLSVSHGSGPTGSSAMETKEGSGSQLGVTNPLFNKQPKTGKLSMSYPINSVPEEKHKDSGTSEEVVSIQDPNDSFLGLKGGGGGSRSPASDHSSNRSIPRFSESKEKPWAALRRISSATVALKQPSSEKSLPRANSAALPDRDGFAVPDVTSSKPSTWQTKLTAPCRRAHDKLQCGNRMGEGKGCMAKNLFCCPTGSRISKRCRNLVDPNKPLCSCKMRGKTRSVTFDGLILLVIIASSISLAFEGPSGSASSADVFETELALGILEVIFTIVFVAEIVIKSIAWGFVWHKGSYLRDGYNVIDFAVAFVSVANLVLLGADVGFLRTLRLVRCLRPLRVISRNEGMRVVVNSLFYSFKALANVMGVLLLVWLMFAILGVQLFSGAFDYCTDPSFPPNTPREGIPDPANQTQYLVLPCDSSRTFADEESGAILEAEWVTPEPNFDSVPQSMLFLFIMSSGEGWPNTMFQAADSTSPGHSPERDASPYAAYFFVVFVCVGDFFLMNLFLGVMFEEFMRLKKQRDRFGLLTDNQREWVRQVRKLAKSKPQKVLFLPHSEWRAKVFAIVNSTWFEMVVMFIIGLNIVTLSMGYDEEPSEYRAVLEIINFVFTGLFIIEAVLKLIGLGVKQYFQDGWNVFDFTVVAGSLVDIFFSFITTNVFRLLRVGRVIARVFRLLRVARIIRLARTITGLRRLLLTLWSTLPSLANVGSLLLILFFMYGIFGVQAFGKVEQHDALTTHANFENFGTALLLLFRMATGEGWDGIMFATQQEEYNGTSWAPLYFVTFVLLATFVLLNLFIMIIVEDFENYESREGVGMAQDQLNKFQAVWSVFDPEGTQFIDRKQFPAFMRALPPPMGIPRNAPFRDYLKRVKDMQLSTWASKVHFREVLLGVHRTVYGEDIPTNVLEATEAHPSALRERLTKKIMRRIATGRNFPSADVEEGTEEEMKRDTSLKQLAKQATARMSWWKRKFGKPSYDETEFRKELNPESLDRVVASVTIQRGIKRWLHTIRNPTSSFTNLVSYAIRERRKSLQQGIEAEKLALFHPGGIPRGRTPVEEKEEEEGTDGGHREAETKTPPLPQVTLETYKEDSVSAAALPSTPGKPSRVQEVEQPTPFRGTFNAVASSPSHLHFTLSSSLAAEMAAEMASRGETRTADPVSATLRSLPDQLPEQAFEKTISLSDLQ